MDVAAIGFLKADRHRLRVLETVGKKAGATAQQISHRLRILPVQTDATIKELLEKGLIKEEEKIYSLTGEGMKVLAQVSRAGM